MLETSEERVRLLKAGIFGKTIERLYVIYNGFKVVDKPIHYEPVRIDTQRNINNTVNQEAIELSL